MGRPRGSTSTDRTTVLQVRCTPAQKEAWTRATEASKWPDLSEAVRRVLDGWAAEELEEVS